MGQDVTLEKAAERGKTDYFAGVKAGILAGLVSFVFIVVTNYVLLYFLEPVGDFLTWNFFSVVVLQGDLAPILIVGVVIGLIFTLTHDMFLRNMSLERKGMIYGGAYWLVADVPGFLIVQADRIYYFTAEMAIAFAGLLIFGYFLGRLYREENAYLFGAERPVSAAQGALSRLFPQLRVSYRPFHIRTG